MAPDFFVHEQALCETSAVGAGTKIWPFCQVLQGARIGRECNISAGVFIENDVKIGDRVTIKSGTQLCDGIELEDDVFLGSNVAFTNDPFPRSKKYRSRFSRTFVRHGASVGAGAVILPGLTIGRSAMVGAGSVVTASVPDFAKVFGNPARIVGYINSESQPIGPHPPPAEKAEEAKTAVDGVRIIPLTHAEDLRGSLVAANLISDVSFDVKRFFTVFDVPSGDVRGGHAHKECHQFLVAVNGSLRTLVSDGRSTQNFTLDSPKYGLYMPPMTWGTQYQYSSDAVLLVLASHLYDPEDYIRCWEDFVAAKYR